MWFMYNTLIEEERQYIYGKGFTLYGLLDSSIKCVPEPSEIENKIKERYYNYIIFGSSTRDLSYLDIVLTNYYSNEIAFVDGEDVTRVNLKLLNSGTYFKRELSEKVKGVYPISFAIPAQKIISHVPEKSKHWGINYPGKLSTYIFDTEDEYVKDYQTSFYAVTFKKAGWDCLRHYEIIANGCLPYFTDIFNCPENTMHNYPKAIVRELCEKIKNSTLIGVAEYQNYVNILLDYCRKKLTTIVLANYVIDTLVSITQNNKTVQATSNPRVGINFINKVIRKHKTKDDYVINYQGLSSIQDILYLNTDDAVVFASDEFLSAQNSLKNIVKSERLKIGQLNENADLIIIDQLLPYKENLHQYMLMLISMLNSDGRLIIIVPNYSNYGTVLGFFKGDYKFGRLKMAKQSQVNFYSVKTIIEFLERYGFKVLGYDGFEYDDNNSVKRFLNKRKSLKYWSCKKIIIEASFGNE